MMIYMAPCSLLTWYIWWYAWLPVVFWPDIDDDMHGSLPPANNIFTGDHLNNSIAQCYSTLFSSGSYRIDSQQIFSQIAFWTCCSCILIFVVPALMRLVLPRGRQCSPWRRIRSPFDWIGLSRKKRCTVVMLHIRMTTTDRQYTCRLDNGQVC